MPFAPPQQPVQGARLADSEIRPSENATDKDHRILAFECRVMNGIKIPVYMAIEVAHIVW